MDCTLLRRWAVQQSVKHYYYYWLLWEFFTPMLTDGFPQESEWQPFSFSFQNSYQYSDRSLVWMVSTYTMISEFSSSITNRLGIVPSATAIIGITVTFMFHSFSLSLARSKYLYFCSPFFYFYSVVGWNSKVHYSAGSPFLLTITKYGCLTEIRLSICILKSQRSLCISFSRMNSGLCICH